MTGVEVEVEAEVVMAWREAEAVRALAGADRDVADYRAEMRAHTRGLGALSRTQIDHCAGHKAEVARVNTGLARVEAGLHHIVPLSVQPGCGARPQGAAN